MSTRFELLLESVLVEQADQKWKAAVAVVQNGDKWLLGLSRSDDDRRNRWVFPGGGVKHGEDAKKAAMRECWEETGIRCEAIAEPFALPGKPDVAFVHCKVKSRSNNKFSPNHEFSALGFVPVREMRTLKLYHNVLKLIKKVA